MSNFKWPLIGLLQGARNISTNRSNGPGVRDLESMLEAFKYWHDSYDKSAKKHRERAAKLELIDDKDASWERRARDSDETDAAKCLVGMKALEWAISELKQK